MKLQATLRSLTLIAVAFVLSLVMYDGSPTTRRSVSMAPIPCHNQVKSAGVELAVVGIQVGQMEA